MFLFESYFLSAISSKVSVSNFDIFVWRMGQHFPDGLSKPITSGSIDPNVNSNCARGGKDQWDAIFWVFRNSGTLRPFREVVLNVSEMFFLNISVRFFLLFFFFKKTIKN